ncbi:hypothetical protein Baya_2435 [Bagarius yarrelli]|uniref:Uncharacterized protein n=1 Tax=Bagarius yarrelli TaxID=175774 RepID=A0A556TNY2_BAGYA|nr:hypothetical protein Baya_2435 [Bagarius yarrelli]
MAFGSVVSDKGMEAGLEGRQRKTQRELLCLQSYQSQASPLETQKHLKAEERKEVASYFLSNAFWEIGWIYSSRSVMDMVACVQQTAGAKYVCTDVQKDAPASPLWADSSQREHLLKAPDGWERARPDSLGLVFNASPIGGARHDASFPAAPPPPPLFLRHAEIIMFVLRTMCSFDSHHPLIDPITPKPLLFSKVFEMPIGGKGEGPAFLNPVNQSGHFSHCCHSPGRTNTQRVNEDMFGYHGLAERLVGGDTRLPKLNRLCSILPIILKEKPPTKIVALWRLFVLQLISSAEELY